MSVETAPRASRLGALLRAAAQVSVGSLVTMAASIARVGLTARLLTPEENGVWLGLQLLMSYSGNLHLGSIYGAFRSVPMLLAKGDEDGATREKSTTFTFVLCMAVVGGLTALFVGARVAPSAERRHLVLVALLIVANLVRMYWIATAKAESRFKELSAAWVAGSVVTTASLALIPLLRLDGLLLGMLAQTVVESALLARAVAIPPLGIDVGRLGGQLRVGLFTLATTVGTLALTTADRAVMLRASGPAAAGTYYLGANIVTLVPALTAIPATVLTPHFFERAARGEDLVPLVERPLAALSVFAAAVSGFGAALLPAVVHRLWPAHVPGIPAAMVALVAACPVVLVTMASNVFYALDRQGQHVLVLVGCAALAYGLGFAGVHATGGAIVGAVAGATLAVLAYYALASAAAMRVLRHPAVTGLRMTVTSLVPLAAVAASLGVLATLTDTWWRGDLGGAALACLAVVVPLAAFVPGTLRTLRGARAAAQAP